METQRSSPAQEKIPKPTAKAGQDFPPDPPPPARGRLERQRLSDWRGLILKRDAAVGNQLWESLAQKLVGLSYLAQALAQRLLPEDPAESRRAKHIAELASASAREACQLAKTLAPKASPPSPK